MEESTLVSIRSNTKCVRAHVPPTLPWKFDTGCKTKGGKIQTLDIQFQPPYGFKRSFPPWHNILNIGFRVYGLLKRGIAYQVKSLRRPLLPA